MKTVLFIFCFILSGTSLMAEPDAKDIVARADQYRGFQKQSFQFELNVVSIRPDKDPRKNSLSVQVKSGSSLILYSAPARFKGRAMLNEGRNLWFFIPGTRKIIRISPAQRLVGEASNGDVAATNFSDDYIPEFIDSQIVHQRSCYHLRLKAIDRKVTYHSIEYWIEKKTFKPVMSNHFAASGKLLKTAYYKSFIKFGDHEKLRELLLVNPIIKGNYTMLTYSHYQQVELPDSLFRKENLNRL